MIWYLPLFLKFLDFSIFRLERALDKIIQVMKRNVQFSIFILLKCAFYQLPWKHCVTRFLDSLTPLEFRLLSAGELITTWIQVLERQLPRRVEASLPRGTGTGKGGLGLLGTHTSATRSAAAAAQGSVTLSAAAPLLRFLRASYMPSQGRDLTPPAASQGEWRCRFLATRADSNNTDGYLSRVGLSGHQNSVVIQWWLLDKHLYGFCCMMMKTRYFPTFFLLRFPDRCWRTVVRSDYGALKTGGRRAVGGGYTERGSGRINWRQNGIVRRIWKGTEF